MVFNVIPPAQAGYIPLAEDLEKFLVAKFGQQYPNFDYKVEHSCDRWIFEAPEKLEMDDIERLIEEIESRNTSV